MNESAWRKLAADFAAEVTELREARGLTWIEFGCRSGVSVTYLRDLSYGRGRSLPSAGKVASIAAALDVDPDYFRITRARAVLSSPKVIDTVYAKLRKPKATA